MTIQSKGLKRLPFVALLIDTFGFSPALALLGGTALTALCVLAAGWVWKSAPPRSLVLAGGPAGSTFERWANTYQEHFAKHGIQLVVLPSDGSIDNLRDLRDPAQKIDVAFVAGGFAKDENIEGLVSLGSIANQPLMVFYRGEPVARLSQLAGKRIAVGAPGSGSRALALALLKSNGVAETGAVFSDLDSAAAASALRAGELDAAFLMGDATPVSVLRELVRAPGLHLFHFSQAEAYTRRHPALNKITLPQGVFDLGANLPAHDVTLVGPTVQLVAREGLHSALSDLLIEVAKETHSSGNLLQKRGEFPAPIEREFPLSEDALRYYKSGKGILYRMVGSFWVASVLNRILVVIVPLVLLSIPVVRLMPVLYRFGVSLRLYRCYRPLMRIERESYAAPSREHIDELLRDLDELEISVNTLKVPASFADRQYWLRSHLLFVRDRLRSLRREPNSAPAGTPA